MRCPTSDEEQRLQDAIRAEWDKEEERQKLAGGWTDTWWMVSDHFVDPDQGVFMIARSRVGSDRYYAESQAAAQRLAMALNVLDTMRPPR